MGRIEGINPVLKYKDSTDMYLINSKHIRGSYALDFYGAEKRVEVPSFSNNTSLSIEVRFITNNLNQSNWFINKRSSASEDQWQLIIFEGSLRFSVWNTSLQSTTISYATSNLSINTWYTLSVTLDGSTGVMKMYVDGQEVASGTMTGTLNHTTREMIISGSGINPLLRSFEGLMSDIRVWNVARTQAQIQDFYDKKITGENPDLAAYYDFTDGVGSILVDRSNNRKDGTIIDATWVEI